ncbi:MAG: hypothetical protein FWD01_04415, partial [Defluviitaleaceae bacterium]|nr:hypothetical protein [Defluviitaleaceae bacterium]
KSLITDAFGTLAVYIDEDVNAGTINVMTKTISPSFMQDTSGVIPPNVMTTDTDQTITGTKDFDTILASLIEFGIGSGKYIENVSGSVSAYLDYLLLYNDLTVNGTSKLQGIVTLEGKAFQDWLNQKADIKDIDWATIPANIALPRGRNWRIEIREPGIIQDHNYLRYFYPDTQTAQQDDPVNAVARWIIDDGTGTGMLGKAMRIEYLESGVITDVLNITNSNGVSWTGEYPFIVRPITEISTLWYFGDIKQDPFPTDEPNISSIVEMGIEGVLTFIGDVNNLRTQNKQIVPAINELYGTITGDILAGHIYCFDTEVETHMTWFDSRKIFKRSIQWSGSLSSSTGGTNIGTAANLLGDTNATVVNPPAEIFNATTGASGGAQCMVSGGNLFVAVNNSISGGGDWYITLYYVKGQ